MEGEAGRQQQQRKKHLDEEGGLGVSQKGGRGGRGDKTQTIDYLTKNCFISVWHQCDVSCMRLNFEFAS